MEQTITILSLLIALSVASERLVEIIKGYWPWLNEPKEKTEEAHRKSALQLMAVGSGILTAWLAYPAIQKVLPPGWNLWCIVPLGLLASGGSGLWNAVLGYVLKVKDIAKFEAEVKRKAVPN